MPPIGSHLFRILALVLAVGCSSGGEKDSRSRPANVTRSATCLQWQEKMCGYLTERCESLSAETCADQFQALFCLSDEQLRTCMNALPSATCPEIPDACEDVTDPEPAQYYCEEFVDVLCTRAESCNVQSKESCIDDASSSLPCDSAVGASPEVELCLAIMPSWSCSELSAGGLPPSCLGVIKLD